MEREKKLEEGLIGLMCVLGISKVEMMLSLSIIRSCHLQEELVVWIASFHNSDRDMTAQMFLAKVRALSEGGNNSNRVRFGSYCEHPERYDKLKKADINDD